MKLKYFFDDCLKTFLSVVTSLKVDGNFKNDQLLKVKRKTST